MKKIILGILFLFTVFFEGFSQTIPPPYINYQAILYDVNGPNPNAPYALQSFPAYINLNDELGNLLYREEHFSSTDANGQVTIKIGDGLYLAGPITNFNQIDWATGKYYLVVEFDINGSISSTAPEQLVTVPYAFYAGKSGNGIASVSAAGNQTLTFTFDNGSTYTTPTLSGFAGATGPAGPTGPAGQSAYDLWLAQGNTGTVDDFLTASAYDIWLAQGNTGTQQDFLNTLVGPAGANGAAGPQGPAGADGAAGPQGPTGLIAAGSTAGNTPYWNGSAWVTNNSNIFNNGGNVGIGTATPTVKLEVNGRLKTQGINELSDKRYKKDIATLVNALDKLQQLRGVSYNWRADEFPQKNFDAKLQIGLIAQELEVVYPELVNTDAEGYKSVDYSKMVAVLIEAVKEQQTQIAALTNNLAEQKTELGELKASVSELNALVNAMMLLQAEKK